MEFVEAEGDTIDEAIGNALKLLGVERDKVTVDILSEGRRGILGFGAQKARIRAALRKPPGDVTAAAEPKAAGETPAAGAAFAEIADKARIALQEVLRLMGFEATVEQRVDASSREIVLEIHAENSGLLIGRKGQTLEALQYWVTRIAGERPGNDEPHIVVDVENYRARRRKALEDMALRLGEKAKRQRKTVTVEALSAADRRIIHAALQDDPWVSTKSLGQGPYRRLLIIPEGDRKKKESAGPPGQEKPAPNATAKGARSASARAPEDEEEG